MTEVKITPEILDQHNLTADEYEKILKILGREPNLTELGPVSGVDDRELAAEVLLAAGAKWVLVKGGHDDGPVSAREADPSRGDAAAK